jgi:hypothetical protein
MLPAGLTPVQAGRLGLWLLGRRQHRAALRRRAIPKRAYKPTPLGSVCNIFVPWSVHEYPGASLWLAQVLGIRRSTADRYLRMPRIPASHARRMARLLRDRAAQCEALAQVLDPREKIGKTPKIEKDAP